MFLFNKEIYHVKQIYVLTLKEFTSFTVLQWFITSYLIKHLSSGTCSNNFLKVFLQYDMIFKSVYPLGQILRGHKQIVFSRGKEKEEKWSPTLL